MHASCPVTSAPPTHVSDHLASEAAHCDNPDHWKRIPSARRPVGNAVRPRVRDSARTDAQAALRAVSNGARYEGLLSMCRPLRRLSAS